MVESSREHCGIFSLTSVNVVKQTEILRSLKGLEKKTERENICMSAYFKFAWYIYARLAEVSWLFILEYIGESNAKKGNKPDQK